MRGWEKWGMLELAMASPTSRKSSLFPSGGCAVLMRREPQHYCSIQCRSGQVQVGAIREWLEAAMEIQRRGNVQLRASWVQDPGKTMFLGSGRIPRRK